MEMIMKSTVAAMAILAFATPVFADDVSESSRLLCSASEVRVCIENAECFDVLAWELGMPQFLVIDTRKKVISTTKSSGLNRSTPIRTILEDESAVFFQGMERGRAFSFVIDRPTGIMSAAVARDGLTASVFGACTDAKN
jgi:hypothetical protein